MAKNVKICETAKGFKAQGEKIYHQYRARKSEVKKYKKMVDKPENEERNKLKREYNNLVDRYNQLREEKLEKRLLYECYKKKNDEIRAKQEQVKNEKCGGIIWRAIHHPDWRQLLKERAPIQLMVNKYSKEHYKLNQEYKDLLNTLYDLTEQIKNVSKRDTTKE